MAKPPQIRPISESKHTFFCVYGDPGCGKTTLAGSAGKGTLIVRPPIDHTDAIVGSGADEWVVHSWDDMLEVQEFARHEGGSEYDWIWLDSVSLWQDVGMDDIWQGVIAQKPHRLAAFYDRGEYRINMGRISEWVRYMIGNDTFNFGMTAHPFWATFRENEGEGDDVTKLMPWIQGKSMPQKLCGMMNLVAYMTVHKRKEGGQLYRKLSFHGTENFYAKDGLGAFPKGYVVNPNLPAIAAASDAARKAKQPVRSIVRRRTRRTAT